MFSSALSEVGCVGEGDLPAAAYGQTVLKNTSKKAIHEAIDQPFTATSLIF